ncbi:hypothetical protein PIB30_016263 [Stylosanthes scabra]|uniref:Uncharacterized protein n=1 Tax=Stylosanthes scabra TaxID=79078 RepID=A0ABU6Y7M5_9FABA|nr:hypothetical protein [Stylosanthes scabra]
MIRKFLNLTRLRISAYKKASLLTLFSFYYLLPNVSSQPSQMAPRKDKAPQLPTYFSKRLAALRARQARDEAGPSNAAPHIDEVIKISSDSDSEQVPEYLSGEGAGIEEEEEVPEYVPREGALIEVLQPLNQEEPEDIPYDGPLHDLEDEIMEE